MHSKRTLRSFVRRSLLTVGALALPVLFGGWSSKWLTGPQSTFDTEGPVAKAQLEVFYTTLWVTGTIFVIVAAVLAYATFKFRAKTEADEHAEPPPQGHGNPLVELSLIVASVGALVIIAIPTLHAIWFTYDVPEAEKKDAYTINATGYQWWFKFEYPTEEIDLPNGGGKGKLITANEMVIPAGRPVHINLRTFDVIHSFWVPKLAGKVDMMPNRGNIIWMKADKPGYFWGQCAEFCGEDHAVMRFRVIALPEAEFQAWLAGQKQNARVAAAQPASVKPASYSFTMPERNTKGYSETFDADPFGAWHKQQAVNADEDVALIAKGRETFSKKTCVACHVIRGHHQGGAGFAPDLTHVASRTTIAGGLLENTATNLHRWVTDPNNVKPGNKMYRGVGGMLGYTKRSEADADTENWVQNISVSDEEARALVAYLHSLK